MKEIMKRYRIRHIGSDGICRDTYAMDLETAAEYAKKVDGRVYAVYIRPRSNVYMDVDEFVIEIKI